jgi:hypothetical protein
VADACPSCGCAIATAPDSSQELERLRVTLANTHEALEESRAQLSRARSLLERSLTVLDEQLGIRADEGGDGAG